MTCHLPILCSMLVTMVVHETYANKVPYMWKFLLNRKQTGFSRLFFCGSQVHRGKVACYVPLQISNCCELANFHGLNFHCICR